MTAVRERGRPEASIRRLSQRIDLHDAAVADVDAARHHLVHDYRRAARLDGRPAQGLAGVGSRPPSAAIAADEEAPAPHPGVHARRDLRIDRDRQYFARWR